MCSFPFLRQNFELTKHRLIYEGALTWRTKGQKNVDLHVVLLEEYILLLQKQDDKYVLKFHSINYPNSKEDSKCTHSPIIKIATVLVRPVATGISIAYTLYHLLWYHTFPATHRRKQFNLLVSIDSALMGSYFLLTGHFRQTGSVFGEHVADRCPNLRSCGCLHSWKKSVSLIHFLLSFFYCIGFLSLPRQLSFVCLGIKIAY